MPIQRVADINLESEFVCSFLRSASDSYDDFLNTEFIYDFDQGQYREIEPAIDLPPHDEGFAGQIYLYTAEIDSVEVLDRQSRAHRDFGTCVARIAHPLTLSSRAHVFVRRTVTQARRDEIDSAARSFTVGTDDIEDLETRMLQGGDSSDFYIVLSWTLTRRGPQERDNSQQDAMRRSLPGEQWELVFRSGTSSCIVPDLDFGDLVLVKDLDDPAPELGEKARNDHVVKDCLNLVATPYRVGTLLEYPESKIEWEMKTVRIGRCRLGKLRLPQAYVRLSKKALYAYVISPDTLVQHYIKTFKSAVEDALKLLPSLVWMVVKGDLGGAKTAFKDFVNVLLDKSIPEDVRRCVFPELDIVTEYGDWKKWP